MIRKPLPGEREYREVRERLMLEARGGSAEAARELQEKLKMRVYTPTEIAAYERTHSGEPPS